MAHLIQTLQEYYYRRALWKREWSTSPKRNVFIEDYILDPDDMEDFLNRRGRWYVPGFDWLMTSIYGSGSPEDTTFWRICGANGWTGRSQAIRAVFNLNIEEYESRTVFDQLEEDDEEPEVTLDDDDEFVLSPSERVTWTSMGQL